MQRDEALSDVLGGTKSAVNGPDQSKRLGPNTATHQICLVQLELFVVQRQRLVEPALTFENGAEQDGDARRVGKLRRESRGTRLQARSETSELLVQSGPQRQIHLCEVVVTALDGCCADLLKESPD